MKKILITAIFSIMLTTCIVVGFAQDQKVDVITPPPTVEKTTPSSDENKSVKTPPPVTMTPTKTNTDGNDIQSPEKPTLEILKRKYKTIKSISDYKNFSEYRIAVLTDQIEDLKASIKEDDCVHKEAAKKLLAKKELMVSIIKEKGGAELEGVNKIEKECRLLEKLVRLNEEFERVQKPITTRDKDEYQLHSKIVKNLKSKIALLETMQKDFEANDTTNLEKNENTIRSLEDEYYLLKEENNINMQISFNGRRMTLLDTKGDVKNLDEEKKKCKEAILSSLKKKLQADREYKNQIRALNKLLGGEQKQLMPYRPHHSEYSLTDYDEH